MILTPFPNIAMHIVKSKSIGIKYANWGGFLSVKALRPIAIGARPFVFFVVCTAIVG
jgi:hypothetical protein